MSSTSSTLQKCWVHLQLAGPPVLIPSSMHSHVDFLYGDVIAHGQLMSFYMNMFNLSQNTTPGRETSCRPRPVGWAHGATLDRSHPLPLEMRPETQSWSWWDVALF